MKKEKQRDRIIRKGHGCGLGVAWAWPGRGLRYPHCDVRELLLGQVEGVIDDRDAKLRWIGLKRQVSSQDGVVRYVHEGHHCVPSFIIEPHL